MSSSTSPPSPPPLSSSSNEQNTKLNHNVEARNVFWKEVQKAFPKFCDVAPKVWSGTNANLYRDEKEVIMTHITPYFSGLCVTCLMFATFRFGGSQWFKKFYDYFFKVPKLKPQVQEIQHQSEEWIGYLKKKQSITLDATRDDIFQLPMDFFVSLLAGSSIALFLSKPQNVLKDFAEAPLIPKKSVIYSQICPDFVKSFDELNDRVEGTYDGDEIVETFQAFVTNCRIRSKYIQQRQAEGAENPDLIPYPGLDGKKTFVGVKPKEPRFRIH